MELEGWSENDVELYALHQSNHMIIKKCSYGIEIHSRKVSNQHERIWKYGMCFNTAFTK